MARLGRAARWLLVLGVAISLVGCSPGLVPVDVLAQVAIQVANEAQEQLPVGEAALAADGDAGAAPTPGVLVELPTPGEGEGAPTESGAPVGGGEGAPTPTTPAPVPTATPPSSPASPTATGAPGNPTAPPAPPVPTSTAVPPPQPSEAPSSPPPEPTATAVPPTPTSEPQCPAGGNASFETTLLSLINAERASRGLGALTMKSALRTAARLHSTDMACNDFFSHRGSNGSTPFTRIAAQGYSFSAAGETIYAGSGSYNSPSAAFNGWMNSAPHREIMLNPNFTSIGIGYMYNADSTYGGYFTADFTTP
jgi:uncharacterized protein YkwD